MSTVIVEDTGSVVRVIEQAVEVVRVFENTTFSINNPAGNNREVQFNDNGNLGASSNLVFTFNFYCKIIPDE